MFLTCRDALNWSSVIRLAEATCTMDTPDTWPEVRHLRQQHSRLRVLRMSASERNLHVAHPSVSTDNNYRRPHRRPGIWSRISPVATRDSSRTRAVGGSQSTHKLRKNGDFVWKQRRMTEPARVAGAPDCYSLGYVGAWTTGAAATSTRRSANRRPSAASRVTRMSSNVAETCSRPRANSMVYPSPAPTTRIRLRPPLPQISPSRI